MGHWHIPGAGGGVERKLYPESREAQADHCCLSIPSWWDIRALSSAGCVCRPSWVGSCLPWGRPPLTAGGHLLADREVPRGSAPWPAAGRFWIFRVHHRSSGLQGLAAEAMIRIFSKSARKAQIPVGHGLGIFQQQINKVVRVAALGEADADSVCTGWRRLL